MVVKDGSRICRLAGDVFDSEEEDEWFETMNKLGANIRTVEEAEKKYLEMEKLGMGSMLWCC